MYCHYLSLHCISETALQKSSQCTEAWQNHYWYNVWWFAKTIIRSLQFPHLQAFVSQGLVVQKVDVAIQRVIMFSSAAGKQKTDCKISSPFRNQSIYTHNTS